MPFWIVIAIIAYLLYAVNGITDKFLLSKAVRQPSVYAFYIGITAPFTWLLAPFGLKFLAFPDLLVAIAGGASFVLALYFLYSAQLRTSVSRLLPIEGGLVPVFTMLLAYVFLHERLSPFQLYAFAFLVVGAVIISIKKDATGSWRATAFGQALLAALLFAVSLTITKHVFTQTNFVSGLVWTRLGFFLMSLCFLLSSATRRHVFNAPKKTSSGNKLLYYGARVSGGIAGFLQNYAISLGSVTIVNAMQGSQFMFLLILTSVLSLKYPKILKEQLDAHTLVQKIISVALISFGLILLAL